MEIRFSNITDTYSNVLSIFLLVSVVFVALLIGSPAYAQDKTGEIDKIFSWANATTPGCVCAVSHNGKLIVNRAYGQADLEREVPLTPNSVFDAASLVKQFVAATVLILVEEKRLSLSDDVRKHIPELNDFGHKITLDHLLTHTSGLRDWPELLKLSGISADALTLVLRQRGLNFNPGEEFSYSNSGYVLLKEIVARSTGMSFSEFASKRLFQPLGMNSTTYQTDLRGVIKNRALAYDKENGRWKLDMDLGNDRGGGGALLSTASDLLIWNAALTNERLGKFVTEKIQEPARLNNGRKLGYARGLFLNTSRGGKTVGHTGGSAGYGSILTRIPEQNLSIAILCNSGETGDRSSFARRIFDLLVPMSVETKADVKKPDSPATEKPDLSSKAGLFFNEITGEAMRLVVVNGDLRIFGGPPLITLTKDSFRNPQGALMFLSGDEFALQFTSQDKFELRSMEGQTTIYRRAQPYAPTQLDLQAFVGRYENEEMRSFFEMIAGKDGLVIRLNDSPDKVVEFKPVDPDRFMVSRVMMSFSRDKSGKVVGLTYSNPVIRNIKFTRVGDKATHP